MLRSLKRGLLDCVDVSVAREANVTVELEIPLSSFMPAGSSIRRDHRGKDAPAIEFAFRDKSSRGLGAPVVAVFNMDKPCQWEMCWAYILSFQSKLLCIEGKVVGGHTSKSSTR